MLILCECFINIQMQSCKTYIVTLKTFQPRTTTLNIRTQNGTSSGLPDARNKALYFKTKNEKSKQTSKQTNKDNKNRILSHEVPSLKSRCSFSWPNDIRVKMVLAMNSVYSKFKIKRTRPDEFLRLPILKK